MLILQGQPIIIVSKFKFLSGICARKKCALKYARTIRYFYDKIAGINQRLYYKKSFRTEYYTLPVSFISCRFDIGNLANNRLEVLQVRLQVSILVVAHSI